MIDSDVENQPQKKYIVYSGVFWLHCFDINFVNYDLSWNPLILMVIDFDVELDTIDSDLLIQCRTLTSTQLTMVDKKSTSTEKCRQ